MWFEVMKEVQKEYNTWDSNVVPHRSTNQARTCLTSLSGREAVLSCWYGRIHHHNSIFALSSPPNYNFITSSLLPIYYLLSTTATNHQCYSQLNTLFCTKQIQILLFTYHPHLNSTLSISPQTIQLCQPWLQCVLLCSIQPPCLNSGAQ